MAADPIDRAAEVIARVGCQPDDEPSNLDWEYAQALADAGLLVSPEHDAAVAAKAWTEAVAAVAWAMDRGPDPLRYVAETNPYEREAGETDADT